MQFSNSFESLAVFLFFQAMWRFIARRKPDDRAAVFRSEAARHGYETSPLADELRDEILALLAEPPMRIAAHPYAVAPE